jgi:hypothetical protein
MECIGGSRECDVEEALFFGKRFMGSGQLVGHKSIGQTNEVHRLPLESL